MHIYYILYKIIYIKNFLCTQLFNLEQDFVSVMLLDSFYIKTYYAIYTKITLVKYYFTKFSSLHVDPRNDIFTQTSAYCIILNKLVYLFKWLLEL